MRRKSAKQVRNEINMIYRGLLPNPSVAEAAFLRGIGHAFIWYLGGQRGSLTDILYHWRQNFPDALTNAERILNPRFNPADGIYDRLCEEGLVEPGLTDAQRKRGVDYGWRGG